MNSKVLPGAAGRSNTEKGDPDRSQPPVTGGQQKRPAINNNQGDNQEGDNRNNSNRKRKRRRRDDNDAYQVAYRGLSFTPVPSSGRPGTPHRFFAESYTVQYQPPPLDSDNGDAVIADSNHHGNASFQNDSIVTSNATFRNMRVHRHANGLCVVATNDGAAGTTMNNNIRSSSRNHPDGGLNQHDPSTMELQWCCPTTPDLSAAQKRKRAASMLKQKQQQQPLPEGAVRPTDPLATITDTATSKVMATYPAVVFGSVLEVNTELTVDLLRRDPLLKGYLAVILPTGPFPPSLSVTDATRNQDPAAEETSDVAVDQAECNG